MITPNDYALNLRWLAARCEALYPSSAGLRADAAIDRATDLRHHVGVGQSAQPPDRVPEAEIAALFDAMGLRAPVWSRTSGALQLPVVGFLPGHGWGVITEVTAAGVWRFESERGIDMLSPERFRTDERARFATIQPEVTGVASTASGAESLFRSALSQSRSLVVVAAIAAFCVNLLALAGSLYSMQVYDRVIPTQGTSTLIVLTVGVILASCIELLIKLIRARLLEQAMKRIDLSVSQDIFERVTRIRMDQFPRSVGSLSAQLRSYEAVRAFLAAATMFVAADAPFALLFLLAIFAVGGIELAAVPAIFAAVAVVVGLFFRKRISTHTARGAAAAHQKFGLLVETVEHAECLKAYGARWRQAALWRSMNTTTVNEDARVRHFSEQATYLAAFIQQTSYVAIVGMGAYAASSSGHLTVGALIACSILSGRVLGPVAMLPGLIVQWAHARSALDNLEKVFALEMDNHGVAQPLAPERVRGAYELANLRFAYPGRAETLHIRQLSIQPGERLAIIGPTGVGKTTLLKILAGLYRPQSGWATLDGLDVQQIDRNVLSRRIGYLPQQATLFSGTLRENLLLGLGMVGEADVLDACRRTGAIDIAARHPRGLDLPIDEGGEGLSGGQKQLVAFTRLVLAAPNVWLLDEPTAWMDEQTEARCIAVLRESVREKQTLILVTHNPLLLGLVDRVVILGERDVLVDGSRAWVAQRLQQMVASADATQRSAAPLLDRGHAHE